MEVVGVVFANSPDDVISNTLHPESSAARLRISNVVEKKTGVMDYRDLLWYPSTKYRDDDNALRAGEFSGRVAPMAVLHWHEEFNVLGRIPEAAWNDARVQVLRMTVPWGHSSDMRRLPNLTALLFASGPFDAARARDDQGRIGFTPDWIGAHLAYVDPHRLKVLKLPAGLAIQPSLWKGLPVTTICRTRPTQPD